MGFNFGIKKFKKDKLSEIDFKNNKEYYRDILKEYSPAELSYIDKFEIIPENDISASLLSLELNKNICLGDKIQINSISEEYISNNEKYILDRIKNGKITNFNENEFLSKIKEDAINNGLLKETKIEWRKIIKVLISSISFMALIRFICTTLANEIFDNLSNVADWKFFVFMFAISLVICIPSYLAIYLGTYIFKMKKNKYVRTKKGEIINENLEGLKNYLKDFSNLDERDENSLFLWEDYLIYSVIFNQNKKVIKNICDKYVSI